MSADVRTFKAATMQAALELVRAELGADAIILHTRQISKRRLLPWQRPLEEVEVTAGIGVQLRGVGARPTVASSTAPAPREVGSAKPPAGAAARRSQEATTAPLAPEPVAASASMTAPVRPTIAEQARQTRSGSTVTPPSAPATNPRVTSSQPASYEGLSDILSSPRPARPATATAAATAEPAPTVAGPGTTHVVSGRIEAHASLHERLDQLQRMIAELGQQQARRRLDDIPAALFPLYTKLIDHEVDEAAARELIFRLKQSTSPAQQASPHGAAAVLAQLIEQQLRITTPLRVATRRRTIAALIGPTGVGKTTTIAKLAAQFRLREGLKVGLVTVDTYRVAAVEQLRTYAEIIDLPMKVVTTPAEMRQAIDELRDVDLVLIDTAGRSPRDEVKIQELQAMLREAQPDEVYLVLSTVAGGRALKATAELFAPAGATALVLTKLDEAPAPGVALSIAQQISLPVAYVTTGQDVPEDFEPAHAGRLAGWIVGTQQFGPQLATAGSRAA